MLLRLIGCAALSIALGTLAAAHAGGAKKADPPKTDAKADAKADAKKDAKKPADDKREFDEKEALVGVIQSVDKKDKSVTLLMEKSKRERTFAITSKTEFFGPRGGERGATGIDDECMARGYQLKVVPTKDGRSAAAIQFDIRKGEEKKDEKKKDAKK